MHAKLIYRKGRLSPTNDTFRPCLPYKSITSAFQDIDMPPVHLEDIHMRETSGTIRIANPFRGGASNNKLSSGVLMERTNSADTRTPLMRTSSASGLSQRENMQTENVKESEKPSSATVTVIKPLVSKEFKLPIRPLTFVSTETTTCRAVDDETSARASNQAGSSYPDVSKVMPQSNNATRKASKARAVPRKRSEAPKQVRFQSSDRANARVMAPASSVVPSRQATGTRPVIDMRSRVMARAAALRVLVNLKQQGCKLQSPKDRAEKALAFRARSLKSSSRKVDVAKVWESAVKFFQAEHAHKLVASMSATRS